MPRTTPVTPVYATGDLSKILEIEQRQLEETVEDLSEEQMQWRPNENAKSALDILWHLAYSDSQPEPKTKAEALALLRADYEKLQKAIDTPGKLESTFKWWTGDEIPFSGVIWGAIRHRCYHLGELVYLRQVMGVDIPKYYHDK